MLKAAAKSILIVVWIALFYLPVFLCHRFGYHLQRDRMVRLCHAGLLYLIGIKVNVVSEPSSQRPLLLVSNHLSYLDIPILASQFPVCFTPKAEIAKWPVIGSICRITGSLFITRKTSAIEGVSKELVSALSKGTPVCLYPEGTTGNGQEIKPFKSSFFSLAEQDFDGRKLLVQPVAIAYRSIRKLPIDRSQWPELAWYGDMELLPHLWNLLLLGHIQVDLAFLEPVTIERFSDRKELAAHCRTKIHQYIDKARLTSPIVNQKKILGPAVATSSKLMS
ncbi:MAG: 1-acyl-sn-glycerol-3-phosphate acyltransferase [Rickettsiales bacterium]|jgi:1-acyl-sn-glycerol-3-phosphate acyltransferase|nr:1-acyl-sn-glycerol-3-phosphate acyltransferase [Rickettsiales bacterium]